MTKADRKLKLEHPANFIRRDGNSALWNVQLSIGNIVKVRVHAMAGEATAIKTALARKVVS